MTVGTWVTFEYEQQQVRARVVSLQDGYGYQYDLCLLMPDGSFHFCKSYAVKVVD